MDVAIISFHTAKKDTDMSGLSTSAFYVRDMLTDGNINSKIYSMYNYDEFIYDDIVYLDKDNYSELNNYDSIIFLTPGYTNSSLVRDKKLYLELVDSIKVNYSIMIHDEHYKRLYPLEHIFTESKYFSGYVLVDELMLDRFEFLDGHLTSVSMVTPKLNPWDYIESCAKSKEGNQIASTSRVITHKRQFELLELYEDFKANNVSVKCYGSLSANWTYLKIKNELSDLPLDDILYGVYYPEALHDIMSKITYHYDLCYYKIGKMNKSVGKRLELTTLEGLNEGCVSIISEEMKPIDFPDDAAIVVPKNCEHELVDLLPMDYDTRISYIKNMYDYVMRKREQNINNLVKHLYNSLLVGGDKHDN